MPLADRATEGTTRVDLGDAHRMDELLVEWRILAAAALVGIARRALELGVRYVLDRHQFGRPIGSYQSIQHGLADFPALIDGARFLTHKAAWATRPDRRAEDPDPAVLASMAFLQAGEAAAVCTDRSLHYHGGYGFSLEYDIQLYFRRARGWASIAGDPAGERRRLADLLWPKAG
ncbi:MAG: acyl-CoA dehydrogenase family protein [Acidimicrobiales bacterium]